MDELCTPHWAYRACYLGPTWVFYGRSHMSVTVWDSYWSYMGVPIWVTRIHPTHPTLGPYMIAIWATLGSIIGVSICACPHWTHMGVPTWAWPYGTITHGAHIGLLSGPHMGLIWACPYGHTFMSLLSGPTWVHYGQPI